MLNRTCNRCNKPLTTRQKKFCSHLCANITSSRANAGAKSGTPWRTCTIDGCEKPSRSRVAELCPMHYHRAYRHGSTGANFRNRISDYKQVRAYKTVPAKGHPLAMKNGRAYEHRVVLYSDIGPGQHDCYWCGTLITWGNKGDENNLVPDHLNGREDDNRVENLVPSCVRCNTTRAQQLRIVSNRLDGAWKNHDTIARLSSKARAGTVDPYMVQRVATA